MAVLPTLLLILGVSTVNAVKVVVVSDKNDKKAETLVRREALELQASGEIQEFPEELFADQEKVEAPGACKSGCATECDRQFLLMAEGVDACSGSGEPVMIREQIDCKTAGAKLGLEIAEEDHFFLNTYEVNPLPYPHGCFLNTTTNKVAYNPSESNGTAVTGKKICVRSKYISGTANTNPTGTPAGCTGDAKPITTVEACWEASKCAAGGDAPKLLDFLENRSTYKAQDKPQGCFKDTVGYWGFNYLETAPTGPIVNGTAVCLNEVAAAA